MEMFTAIWLLTTVAGKPFGTVTMQPTSRAECVELIQDEDAAKGVAAYVKQMTGVTVTVEGVCHPVQP